MAKKSNQITLNELRDKSVKTSTNTPFGKKIFGGYNSKQVSEYIESLTENLRSAEESFNNRLEEYASMTTMLKQERDQYGEMYNACKESKIEMVQQIDSLKSENDELNKMIKAINLEQGSQANNPLTDELAAENIELKNKLSENQSYEQECIRLKDQLDQLKLMVQELNAELKNYAQNELSGNSAVRLSDENSDKILAENEVLKRQYEDVLDERSSLYIDNKSLIEENKRLSDCLVESNKKYEELSKLKDINLSTEATTKQIISEFESKAYEYAQNHQSNINQITENIKSALNLLSSEKDEMSKLIEFGAIGDGALLEDEFNMKSAIDNKFL